MIMSTSCASLTCFKVVLLLFHARIILVGIVIHNKMIIIIFLMDACTSLIVATKKRVFESTRKKYGSTHRETSEVKEISIEIKEDVDTLLLPNPVSNSCLWTLSRERFI